MRSSSFGLLRPHFLPYRASPTTILSFASLLFLTTHPYSFSKLDHTAIGSKHLTRCASAQQNKTRLHSPACVQRSSTSEATAAMSTNQFRHKSHLWECFSKQITANIRKPALASQMSDYVQMWWVYFILLWCKNQRFHYSTETNILKGHEKVVWDMQDVMYKLEDRVISFMTLHCRWGIHLK